MKQAHHRKMQGQEYDIYCILGGEGAYFREGTVNSRNDSTDGPQLFSETRTIMGGANVTQSVPL